VRWGSSTAPSSSPEHELIARSQSSQERQTKFTRSSALGAIVEISNSKRVIGMHDVNGVDWVWMTLAMGAWIVVIGAVVYAAVKLATRDRQGSTR
jgi:heme/copper-type cytochrome/quinol oxidase subunit 2